MGFKFNVLLVVLSYVVCRGINFINKQTNKLLPLGQGAVASTNSETMRPCKLQYFYSGSWKHLRPTREEESDVRFKRNPKASNAAEGIRALGLLLVSLQLGWRRGWYFCLGLHKVWGQCLFSSTPFFSSPSLLFSLPGLKHAKEQSWTCKPCCLRQ